MKRHSVYVFLKIKPGKFFFFSFSSSYPEIQIQTVSFKALLLDSSDG